MQPTGIAGGSGRSATTFARATSGGSRNDLGKVTPPEYAPACLAAIVLTDGHQLLISTVLVIHSFEFPTGPQDAVQYSPKYLLIRGCGHNRNYRRSAACVAREHHERRTGRKEGAIRQSGVMASASSHSTPMRSPGAEGFWSWVLYIGLWVVPVAGAATASWLFSYRATLPAKDPNVGIVFWWATGVAALALAATVVKIILEQVRTNREKQAAVALADAVADAEAALAAVTKRALEQLAEAIAEMPHLDPSEYDGHMRMVAKHAVDAVNALVSERVTGMRANVFELTRAKDGLRCVESTAKRHPAPFLPGDAETAEALQFLNSGDPLLYYPDLSKKRPKSTGRRRTNYKTFMSLPIAAPIPAHDGPDRNVYGMLTVDAPEPSSFAQRDIDTAELVADILASAFAIVEKNREPEAPVVG